MGTRLCRRGSPHLTNKAPRQGGSGAGLRAAGWRTVVVGDVTKVCSGARTHAPRRPAGGSRAAAARRTPRPWGRCRQVLAPLPPRGVAVVALRHGDHRTPEARHSQSTGMRIVAPHSAVAAGLV